MYVVMSKLKDRISTDNKHMIKYIKYIMRKIVLSLFALCCFSAVMAQQKTRSLSVELLGAQNCWHQLRQPFQGQLGLRLPRGSRLWLWQHFRFVRPENQWRWCSVGAKLSARKEEQQTGAGLRCESWCISSKGNNRIRRRYMVVSRWGEYRRNFS